MSIASATDIVKYLGSMSSMLSKGDRTASGETDDKTPEELPQKEGMAALSTDGRAIANAVFTSVHAKMPAELLAMSDAYDATQACTRMAGCITGTARIFMTLPPGTSIRASRGSHTSRG